MRQSVNRRERSRRSNRPEYQSDSYYFDEDEYKDEYRHRKRYKKRRKRRKGLLDRILLVLGIIAGVLAVLAITALCLYEIYTVKTVHVEGNVHYFSQEIMDMVMTGKLGHNSLYLSLKYKDKSIEDVPFISAMDVDVVSPSTIKITVYEKPLAGCVQYLDSYMYFDRDGMIIETSGETTAGVPVVTGLKYDAVVLYEQLPVADADVFEKILSITQLLGKYNLTASQIAFDNIGNITVYCGTIRIALGNGDNIDEKITTFASILPELEGKSGTLKLENYSSDKNSFIFTPDN